MGVGQALQVYENEGNNSLSLREERQATSFPLSKIKLLEKEPVDLSGGKSDNYCPYFVDFDLDGDLDLVLISRMPHIATVAKPRFFQHNDDHSVSELTGPPNSSCPLNWSLPFSATDFNGDGLVDLIGIVYESPIDMEVLVCLQGPDGYVPMDQQQNPFYPSKWYLEEEERHACIWEVKTIFLDWDADGDVDQLCIDLQGRLLLVEQVGNGTLSPRPLPLTAATDFVASDFDGDGDVDLILSLTGLEGWKYYERTEDGSLLELFENENPFHISNVWSIAGISDKEYTDGLCAALGDWNNDGAQDLVAVGERKVRLFWNKPLQSFIEYDREHNPFSEIHLKEPNTAQWNMVDVDGDGDLDLVLLHAGKLHMLDKLAGTHEYFQQNEEGGLVHVQGEANPLLAAPTGNKFPGGLPGLEILDTQFFGTVHMVADVDGDGDLDVVHGFRRGLAYAEQRNGTFVVMTGKNNPFYEGGLAWLFGNSNADCWTLVDFDGDGDLDMVKTKPSQLGAMTSVREVLYYEQAATL